MKFREINADYYDDIVSYYKIIMQKVENTDILKQITIKEIFNGLLNSLDKDLLEVKAREILRSTSLFEKKLLNMDSREIKRIVDMLYSDYILPMIHSYQNGDLDQVKKWFVDLHDKVLQITNYYGVYGDSYNDFMVIRNGKKK